MKTVSVQIPFDSTKEEIAEATKRLTYQIFKEFLGTEPTRKEVMQFDTRFNPTNSAINEIYFAGNHFGSLTATIKVDEPKGINFEFNLVNK